VGRTLAPVTKGHAKSIGANAAQSSESRNMQAIVRVGDTVILKSLKINY